MGSSLQDQLLKAGLGDKQKANRIKQEKRKKAKQAKKHKIVETDETKESVQAAAEAKKAKDRELNAKRKEEAEQKAVLAQIKQLITINRQAKNDGEVVLNFTDDNKIKRLYVSDKTQKAVTKGKLAVVRFEDGYELVPTPVADKISERDEQVVVYRADQLPDEPERQSSSEEDDWYADYEIPDDLTW